MPLSPRPDLCLVAASLPATALIELFDCLPGVIFYAKDRESRYLAANRAMLVAKELRAPEELIGKSDRDFHPAALADAYIAEDREVMLTGRPVLNRPWFVIDRSGRPGWFNSSKVPLRDTSGAVVGVAGVRYPVETPEDRARQFRDLAPVVHHLEEHYADVVSMAEMARLAGLSPTHFNRRFRQIFGMAPTRFLHALRIEKARQLLVETDRSVGEIAVGAGYHDQSHFTRHFRKLTGVAPGKYRAAYRK
ncbi:MAG: AraC family transcriptional regulator [Verrucomicrobiae bacterium]|nr:AraC family transcriptional regulator [Verrucomicrobiae bacterium]